MYCKSCKLVTHPNCSTENEPNNSTSKDIEFKFFNSMYDSGKFAIFLLFAKYNSDNFEHLPIDSGKEFNRLYRIESLRKEDKFPIDSGKLVKMFSSRNKAVKFVKFVKASGNVTNRFLFNHNVFKVKMLPTQSQSHSCRH